jgi:hypothetical protein
MTSELNGFVSKACGGERCHCGEPAVRKVGEEILFDDPMPRRHNLTAYICARHYAELMGPLGAQHVGYTRPPVPDKQLTDVVEALREARPFVQRHMTASNRRECALLAKIDALAALNTAPAGDDVIEVTLEMVAAGEAVFRERCGNALPENKAECEAAAIAIYGAMSRAALKATTHTEEKAGE